jgi:hypothetical protein
MGSANVAQATKKVPVGGPGTNQYQVKGAPKGVSNPSAGLPIQMTEDLRNGLKYLVRDENEAEADREEIPSLRRALTDGAAFEDLVRTGIAYGITWALGKLLAEFFDGDFI